MKKLSGVALLIALSLFCCMSVEAQKRSTKSRTSKAQEAQAQVETSPQATAQTRQTAAIEPTLQETMDWLGTKLSDSYFIDHIESYSWIRPQNYHISQCTLTFEQQVKDSNKEYRFRMTIPFADIDPLTIKWNSNRSESNVQMETKSPKRTILFTKDDTVTENSTVIFVFGTGSDKSQNQDRAMKAIKHVVKLCGGKVDPF